MDEEFESQEKAETFKREIKYAELEQKYTELTKILGKYVEDYEKLKPRWAEILGKNIQVVGVSYTLKGDDSQMTVNLKHDNYMEEDEDEPDEDDQEE